MKLIHEKLSTRTCDVEEHEAFLDECRADYDELLAREERGDYDPNPSFTPIACGDLREIDPPAPPRCASLRPIVRRSGRAPRRATVSRNAVTASASASGSDGPPREPPSSVAVAFVDRSYVERFIIFDTTLAASPDWLVARVKLYESWLRVYPSGRLTPSEKRIVEDARRRCRARFKFNDCFANAKNLVRADVTGTLMYCEGLADDGRLHHGWALINGKVVDPTGSAPPLHRVKGCTKVPKFVLGTFGAKHSYRGAIVPKGQWEERRNELDTEAAHLLAFPDGSGRVFDRFTGLWVHS